MQGGNRGRIRQHACERFPSRDGIIRRVGGDGGPGRGGPFPGSGPGNQGVAVAGIRDRPIKGRLRLGRNTGGQADREQQQ